MADLLEHCLDVFTNRLTKADYQTAHTDPRSCLARCDPVLPGATDPALRPLGAKSAALNPTGELDSESDRVAQKLLNWQLPLV
jgi:hypothetical protein